jgi:hypothetical protein
MPPLRLVALVPARSPAVLPDRALAPTPSGTVTSRQRLKALLLVLFAALVPARSPAVLPDRVLAPTPNGTVTSRRRLKAALGTLCLDGHVLPTVLIIGGQKCGSTTLWADMQKHIAGMVISTPLPGEEFYINKELHHFDREERFAQGLGFYASHFPPCPRDGRTVYAMDATPQHLLLPGMAGRIRDAYLIRARALRMILVIRNPTDRIRSWYDHFSTTLRHAPPSVDAWVEGALKKLGSCCAHHDLGLGSSEIWGSPCQFIGPAFSDALAGGMYAPQLYEWLRKFPAEQFMVVTFGGYLEETDRVLHDIARFISIGQSSVPALHRRALSALELKRRIYPSVHTRTVSNGSHIRTPHIRASHQNGRDSHQKRKVRHEFSPQARASLDAFYRPHIQHFVEMLRTSLAKRMHSSPFSPVGAITPRMIAPPAH